MQDEKTEYKRYLSGRSGAEKYNVFKKILYGSPDSLVLKIFAFVFPYIKKKKEVRILDIGGGDGKRLMQIMDLLESKGIQSKATLVEPSKSFTDDCRAAVKKSRRDIKVMRSLFENFESAEKFDLILVIHSFYSFRDFPVFEKISSLLQKGGYLFIAGNDADSFLARLKRITAQIRRGNRNEIDYILSELEKNGFKCKIAKRRTIFGGCLKNGKLTADGKLIASWIALADWPKISGKMKNNLRDIFKAACKKGKITEKEIFIIAHL